MKVIDCPILNHLTPTEVVQTLVNTEVPLGTEAHPVWLNNNGQNVIGLIPKATFTIQQGDTLASLHLTESYRQAITLSKIDYSHKTVDNSNLEQLQTQLIGYQSQQPTQAFGTTTFYQNGFIGFVSYDSSAENLANNQSNSQTHLDYPSRQQPLAYFGHYDIYLSFKNHQWHLHLTSQHAIEEREVIEQWLAKMIQVKDSDLPPSLPLQPLWQKTDYNQAFDKVQDYLKAGDCYQINLTQCWQGELKDNKLVDYLPQLNQATQAPFAGYLHLSNYELLSCSPELFLTFNKTDKGEHTLITKPIKGTRPRGLTNEQDAENKQALANSEKDRAENVMIVDLLRNDLGKYAKTGSVIVPKLFDIESFSNVHHMVSTISATLKDNIHPLTVLFDSLPAGSITGTPKKRAVEIINELEAQPRGAYCGTLGYLNFDGTGQWNVLIRTLQARHDTSQPTQVSLWAGGGVTIASDCEAEYQECLDKVGNLLKVLANPANDN